MYEDVSVRHVLYDYYHQQDSQQRHEVSSFDPLLRPSFASSGLSVSPLQAQSNLDRLLSLAPSVSLFTVFETRQSRISDVNGVGKMASVDSMVFSSVWVKQTPQSPCPHSLLSLWSSSPSSTGIETIATVPIIPGRPPHSATPYATGPSHLRLPHFVPGFDNQSSQTTGSYDELQTEYSVPMVNASAVLSAIILHPDLTDLPQVLHISEIRLTRGSSNPMAFCYDALLHESTRVRHAVHNKAKNTDTTTITALDGEEINQSHWLHSSIAGMGVHEKTGLEIPQVQEGDVTNQVRRGCMYLQFTWKQSEQAKVERIIGTVEDILIRHNSRPHWGKFNRYSQTQLRDMFSKRGYLNEIDRFYSQHSEHRSLQQHDSSKHPFKMVADAVKMYDPQGKFFNEHLYKFIVNNNAEHHYNQHKDELIYCYIVEYNPVNAKPCE